MVKPTKEPQPAKLIRAKVVGRTIVHAVSGDDSSSTAESLAYFENYSEYSKTLRAWLVAYGIGGPVLFLTNKDLTTALGASTDKRLIISLFLVGVFGQVVLAFINKWCAWNVYAGEHDHSYRVKRSYKLWAWINDRSIFDLIVDAGSMIAFAYSTWLTLQIFV